MNSRFSRLRILYHLSCSYYDEGCWWFSSLCRSLCSPIQHHCCSSTCRRCNWLSICIYFDVFICCTNLRHVKASDALFISITTSSITSISALYHSPIKFFPVFSINLIPSILLPGTNYCVLFFSIVLPSNATWISFDLVIDSFASILLTQEYNTLQHFIYESNLLYFSIATIISPNASIFLLYFSNFFEKNYSVDHYLVDHYLVWHYSVDYYLTINYFVEHYLVNILLDNKLFGRTRLCRSVFGKTLFGRSLFENKTIR